MNKERMTELANFIENLPEKQFNMQVWVSDLVTGKSYQDYGQYDSHTVDEFYYKDCNTICCIAGWTVGLFNETGFIKPNRKREGESIVQEATRLLDLSRSQAVNLFYAACDTYWNQYADDLGLDDDGDGIYYNITNKQAAYVLKDIVAGNLIDFEYDNAEVEDHDWEEL